MPSPHVQKRASAGFHHAHKGHSNARLPTSKQLFRLGRGQPISHPVAIAQPTPAAVPRPSSFFEQQRNGTGAAEFLGDQWAALNAVALSQLDAVLVHWVPTGACMAVVAVNALSQRCGLPFRGNGVNPIQAMP